MLVVSRISGFCAGDARIKSHVGRNSRRHCVVTAQEQKKEEIAPPVNKFKNRERELKKRGLLLPEELDERQEGNWDGDEYVGSRWNELSVLLLLLFVVPVAGLVFAWASYGTLWGTTSSSRLYF